MSLRLRLIGSLAGLLTLVAIAAAVHAFRQATEEADEFLDRQQRQMARYVGDTDFVSADDVGIPHVETEDDYVVTVRYRDGRRTQTSHPEIALPEPRETGFSNVTDAGGVSWRIFDAVLPERTIQIAQRMEVRGEIAEDGAWNAALPILLSIPVMWIVLLLVTRLAFRRLERTAADVAAREATDTTPIDPRGVPSEVRPLIEGINGLLARLERAMRQQRDFVGDAAHALRTPLAAMTLQIDNARAAATEQRLVERLDELKGGAARASDLAQKLLLLARVEATTGGAEDDETDLTAIVTQSVADLTPLAQARGVDLGFRKRESVRVQLPGYDLRVLTDILIDNAVRYTPSGGIVDVSVTAGETGARLGVTDTGPGLPEAMLERVYERFVRVTESDGEGSGLGLAIARSIAHKHGLSLTLGNRTDRQGLTADLCFGAAQLPKSTLSLAP